MKLINLNRNAQPVNDALLSDHDPICVVAVVEIKGMAVKVRVQGDEDAVVTSYSYAANDSELTSEDFGRLGRGLERASESILRLSSIYLFEALEAAA